MRLFHLHTVRHIVCCVSALSTVAMVTYKMGPSLLLIMIVFLSLERETETDRDRDRDRETETDRKKNRRRIDSSEPTIKLFRKAEDISGKST